MLPESVYLNPADLPALNALLTERALGITGGSGTLDLLCWGHWRGSGEMLGIGGTGREPTQDQLSDGIVGLRYPSSC
jgi:hypothetical protein